ncbi:lipocalin family protein [Formosa sp. L2A11]|uniref:lipocalin family protein n=1 Tax=Formosa sp. L2A11 TaxID=2686363 RepID=UPI00131AB677|nr:lipocalin family protein [Formosa sp. L2A11]
MKYSTFIIPTTLILLTAFVFTSCATIPEKAEAVSPFNKKKYLGKWYEIARLDFKYEKDLNNTTANYTINPDSSIKVVNKGYNYVTKEWTEANGKAKFIDSDTIAKLKVSFFGPFYSGYNVISLANDYKYALVAGKNLDYLWILSRETTIPENVKQDFLNKAKAIGYKTQDLIWVEHTNN